VKPPLVAFKHYDAFKEIAATAPAGWHHAVLPKRGHCFCVMLCDEADVKRLKVGDARRQLERQIGSPVIPVLGDSVRHGLHIVKELGGPPVVTLDVPMKDGTWSYWPTYPQPYESNGHVRHGAVFAGRLDYAPRQELVAGLLSAGVRLIDRNNEARTYQDYVNDLQSATAVVNLCADRKTGKPQMKARVIEALLAGTVLLEQENPLTAQWLKPGEEYLPWSNIRELTGLLEGLEKFPEWGQRIAQAGHAAVIERLNPKRFWQRVEALAA
jgi:hypothetical protein